MNRRGFIAKALAGIAAIPFLSKLTKAQFPVAVGGPINGTWMERDGREHFYAAYRRVTITFTYDGFRRAFPNADKPFCPVDHDGVVMLRSEHGDHELRPFRYLLREYDVEVSAIIIKCRDVAVCRLGCAGEFYAYNVVDIQTNDWSVANS